MITFSLVYDFWAVSRSSVSSASRPSVAQSDSVTPRQPVVKALAKSFFSRYWYMGELSGTSIVVMLSSLTLSL